MVVKRKRLAIAIADQLIIMIIMTRGWSQDPWSRQVPPSLQALPRLYPEQSEGHDPARGAYGPTLRYSTAYATACVETMQKPTLGTTLLHMQHEGRLQLAVACGPMYWYRWPCRSCSSSAPLPLNPLVSAGSRHTGRCQDFDGPCLHQLKHFVPSASTINCVGFDLEGFGSCLEHFNSASVPLSIVASRTAHALLPSIGWASCASFTHSYSSRP